MHQNTQQRGKYELYRCKKQKWHSGQKSTCWLYKLVEFLGEQKGQKSDYLRSFILLR
ncbi:hypothetical protein VVMO6_01412 [Vibrio vulnificus MO6-24/O]|nr:hypothetical protein VVMO6_01412 [Vibrio vulnificus MO6-24/O]